MIIKPGYQIANSQNPDSDFGTLGGIVSDNMNRQILMTCFHCVFTNGMYWRDISANAGLASVKIGEHNVFQQNAGKIERLLRDERVDIALLEATDDNDLDLAIPVFGVTNGIGYLSDSDTGTWLRKYGAVSHDTYGQFVGFAPFGFKYEEEAVPHQLENLIAIRTADGSNFSEKGDSGSFVMNDKNQVVGVIVTGDGPTSYAIQASIIVSRLKIKFI